MAEILLYASIPLAFAAICVAIAWSLARARQRRSGRPARPASYYRWPSLVALLCVTVGMVMAVRFADTNRQAAFAEANSQFLLQARQVENDLQDHMVDLNHLLGGVRGLFVARNKLSRVEFKDYIDSRELRTEFPGLRGVGFVERLQRDGLPAQLARLQRETWPGFALHTVGQEPDLFVVKYLEPHSRNEAALGYDIGAEPKRRTAAEAAMRSGHPALTERIQLVQDPLGLPAFLCLVPVYSSVMAPQTEAERVRTLRGWVYTPVVFAEFMASGDSYAQSVNYQLFDSPQLTAAHLIFDSELPSGNVHAAESLTRTAHSIFSVVRPVLLSDRVFYLRTNSSPVFEANYHPREHLQFAVLGSGLGVLAGMVLWLLLVGRARALHIAQGLTQDLDRLAMVARRTFNAVYFADTDWHITWVNEGFTRMSGFEPDEALGRRPSQLLHSPLADPATPDTIDRQVADGNRAQIQVLQRNKQGKDYWVDLEVMPIRDSAGRVTGYLSVQSDITEEVQAKAALVLEKERADNILSATNVGTWDSNLQTGEQRWNDRWAAMLGFARDEVVPDMDQFWHQRLHPTDLVRLNEAMADCICGVNDGYSCDLRALHKDGRWLWILSRAKVMSRTPDGRVEWIGGIHTDITEIKQVELSLRDMEAFLDRAGRIAGVGAWQIDLRTRELLFSAQTCAIHGLAPDFQPTEEVALSFYPEADRKRLQEAMRCAEADGTPWDMVVQFHNAQGEELWVRIFGEVGYDEAGPNRVVGAFQDVTQDHWAQQEVARSSALLRGAIEAINEAFVLFDPQDRLVFCNDKYRAIYAKSADLMVEGASFESIIRGGAERGQYLDALGRVDAWIEERLAAHASGNVVSEQRLNDGCWLRVIERRMPDGHMVGFRVDITELKQATDAAERISAQRGEEQRRLQSILEGTNVGTWEWNVQTGDSLYNEQYVGMLGYTLAELQPIGYETWVRLVHPDDLVSSARMLQEHLRGDRPGYETEVRMQHKDGHWIWVLARGKLAQRLDDGRPLWVYGTHMDITERKLAEQQLAQTSATLQNVLDSATAVGILTMDLEGDIRVFNQGAENLLGYRAEEVVGQQSAGRFFDPTELGALRETLTLVWGSEPTLQQTVAHVVTIRETQEWTLLRKDGSRFKASLIFSPMHDAQNVLLGNLGVVYDISKQKEYESSLRDAMHLAEQSSVAKSQFLANMSHEIRTPMNAILGMLQLMRNTPLNANQRDYTDKAAGAARSLLGLLNDILDFSKVEAGKMQLNPEPFALDALLSDLSVILSSNLGAKNVDLLFDVDPAIPAMLVGDAMRLKQILINLGGNAVKFTEKGEVVIRWTLLARTPERVKVAVAVVDTGIGIAPENQARIFDAFTQAEANTTRRFGGTGLGLVISTRLIRLMGGELQLRSAVGQGSSFGFTLELAVAELGVPLAVPALPAPPVQVLLVDDNAQALSSSAAMMRTLGWLVLEATSGDQALAILRSRLAASEPPLDALFVDAEMPGMDGWETLRNVRRLYGRQPQPLLVLLSRQSRDALAQRSGREQELLDGLMVKPLTSAMFAHTLAQAREGSAAPDQQPPLQAQRLAGMRVLLVEDNPINQQVAQELLSAEGARVTLAENGALGVAAVQTTQPPFDVVLMDLQMPVMDGLSATRLLRANSRYAALPVIAMTANAMRSDRDECLAAGMNDHVGKPFDLNQLVSTLIAQTRWMVAPADTAAAAPAVARAPVAAPQNWPAGLEVEQALARMAGNERLLQRAITEYLGDARQLPQRLEQGLQAGELVRVERELHGFKGLSATVGVPALATLAAQAEKLLRDGAGAQACQALLAGLPEQLAHWLPLLEAVALRLAPAVPVDRSAARHTPVDAAVLAQLRTLLTALEQSDMEAMEMHAQLRQSLDDALAESLEPLDAAMADLEFERAATACAQLLQQFDTNGAM